MPSLTNYHITKNKGYIYFDKHRVVLDLRDWSGRMDSRFKKIKVVLYPIGKTDSELYNAQTRGACLWTISVKISYVGWK